MTAADEPRDLFEERSVFRKAASKADKSSKSEKSALWDIIYKAAANQEAWAGVIAGAQAVLEEYGKDQDRMEAFFRSAGDPASPEWKGVASVTAEAVGSTPVQILSEVQRVVRSVPISAFRSLVNLTWVEYCWNKYSDNPDKLRECIANERDT